MLLGRAAEAARNEDWASVRELVAAILRFDAENSDAKTFLEMANATPSSDVRPPDRVPPPTPRFSPSPGTLPESYPRPDRSDFIRFRRKAPSNEVVDIGWSEGVFETGRPYRVEYWQQDGVTYASFIFSTVGLENEAESRLRELLTDEGLLEIIAADRQQKQSPYRGAAQFIDAATNRMWKVNVVLRDETGAIADCAPEIHPYPREASADLSEVDLSYEEALVNVEEMLMEAEAEAMRDIHRALDSTEAFDVSEKTELRLREVVDLARDAGTQEGLGTAAKALFRLGSVLRELGRPIDDVLAVYREAVDLSREAEIPQGLERAGRVLANVANDLEELGHPLGEIVSAREEAEALLRSAVTLGRQADDSSGSETAASALFRLGLMFDKANRPLEDLASIFTDAAALGRKARTPSGLALAAAALTNLGVTLHKLRRPAIDIRSALMEAARLGRESGLPQGLSAANSALSILELLLPRAERPLRGVEAPYAGDDTVWNQAFFAYRTWANLNSSADVPPGTRYFTVPLGQWVNAQRLMHANGRLLPRRFALLDEFGFIWDAETGEISETSTLATRSPIPAPRTPSSTSPSEVAESVGPADRSRSASFAPWRMFREQFSSDFRVRLIVVVALAVGGVFGASFLLEAIAPDSERAVVVLTRFLGIPVCLALWALLVGGDESE